MSQLDPQQWRQTYPERPGHVHGSLTSKAASDCVLGQAGGKVSACYNEIEPYAADWLENLIAAGHIAPGVVDRRSIADVRPADLDGAEQVHLFAGIGVWSGALRDAGWPDDGAIWTASCPCQPFSGAGKGGGFADERHLWPYAYHLIGECQPPIVVGEQVASKDGLAWLDLVQTDMEAAGYSFGAVDTCAAGFGVEWEASQSGEWLRRAIRDCGDPWIADQLRDFAAWAGAGNLIEGGEHIRQRLYWGAVRLADADERQRRRFTDGEGRERDRQAAGWRQGDGGAEPGGAVGGLADADDARPQGRSGMPERADQCAVGALGVAGGLADANERVGGQGGSLIRGSDHRGDAVARAGLGSGGGLGIRPHPPHGLRRDADWLFCRDGKWRPVEPGTFPLAHGQSGRVGKLRAYGNAIDRAQAAGFLRAFLGLSD